MIGIFPAATLGYVALGVFVPLFVIGLIMLKSISRAFAVSIVFAVGATIGFLLATLAANAAVGHAVSSETRQAMMVAFASAGAAAGGAIAVWILLKNRGNLST
jgi:Na+-transporting NADH:ubiquinone oxidoreductase subunit NqrE